MGNSIGKVCLCSAGAGDISRRHNNNPLGDSILYVRPPDPFSDCDVTTTFRSVSGASVSANSSTPPSTSTTISDVVLDSSASFESSTSFTSSLSMVVPLQNHHHHHASRAAWWSSPMVDIGFSSGPVLNESCSSETVKKLRRSFSHDGYDDGFGNKPKKQNFKKILKRVISGVVSIKKKGENANGIGNVTVSGGLSLHDGEDGIDDDENYLDDGGGDLVLMGSENLQWAQGRAGEDRVHIVISEEHGWVFVGIYDGFNGPDATDYLLDNLFYAVYDELKGLLCGHKSEESMDLEEDRVLLGFVKGNDDGSQMVNYYKENYPMENEKLKVEAERIQMKKNTGWENEGESEKVVLENADAKGSSTFSHSDVLLALSVALRKTEDAFLKSVDEMISNNPVLAMMGSCVLVMLMKGEDVYLMNVGDSRAVLATHSANSLQLTMEHSTHIKEEVQRIRKEHPDDPSAITKGRVKGYLNVTRAFGAGFLKQPKQNNAVLETFKVNYIGESPYISCSPSLHHHRLSPSDRFLILSSDGLHQYFTNEEAVAKVESYITLSPDIDPAQLLIKEALCRAAKKAGMDIHELLEIPQGERRLYHDDISIVIISFEGKIWRSSV